MEYHFIHSQAVWILSGISIVLPLLLMGFLIVNCLRCFRQSQSFELESVITADATRPLPGGNIQQERIRETATCILQDQGSHTTDYHGGSTNTSYQAYYPYDELTIDNLQEVFDKLYRARHKWYNIGIQLGMTADDLDAIKLENRDETDPCLMKMLKMWLRRGKATRQVLGATLKSASVDYPDIATSLLADHSDQNNCEANDFSSSTEVALSSRLGFKCPECGNCSLKEYLDGSCPKADVSCDSPFRCLDIDHLKEDEQTTLCLKLIDETNKIIDEFSDVIINLRQTLKRQHIEPSDIANFVFDHAPGNSLTESLQRDSQFDSEFSSIDKIINYLQKNKYISFINYRLLEHVVKEYGKNDRPLQDALHSYQEKFKSFCERSIFEIPRTAYGTAPANGEILKFKITDKFITSLPCGKQEENDVHHRTLKKSSMTLKLSVDKTLSIQNRIAKALEPALKNVGQLVFLGALKGCIELIFSVPRSVMNLLKPKLKNINISAPTESSIAANFSNLESEGIYILSGPPGKPKAVKDSVTDNSITLEWAEPEYQGFHLIQCYNVHFRSITDPPGRWRTIRTKTSNTTLEMRKLPNNKMPFIFRLQAVNEIGTGIESENSDPINLMKLTVSLSSEKLIEGNYPSQPGKPQALNVTHDSIELEWTKPEQGADNVTSYAILCHSTHPHKYWIEQKAITTEERVLVSQLSENTKYFFHVQSECEGGVGLESDVSDPIKTKMIIPSKPGKPRAVNVTHDSIQLEWTEPEQGAHNVTSYTVFCCSSSDPADYWTKYKAITTEESVLISQLRENTVYYFKIQPHCAGGDGLQSDISDPISTKMIIPSQPGKPKCVLVTHDSIQIEWTKPEQGAHNVTTYTIFCHSTSHPLDVWTQQTVKATEENLTVSGLSQNVIYFFKVRPECGDSFGSESDISEPIKTKKRIPNTQSIAGASTVSFNFKQNILCRSAGP